MGPLSPETQSAMWDIPFQAQYEILHSKPLHVPNNKLLIDKPIPMGSSKLIGVVEGRGTAPDFMFSFVYNWWLGRFISHQSSPLDIGKINFHVISLFHVWTLTQLSWRAVISGITLIKISTSYLFSFFFAEPSHSKLSTSLFIVNIA